MITSPAALARVTGKPPAQLPTAGRKARDFRASARQRWAPPASPSLNGSRAMVSREAAQKSEAALTSPQSGLERHGRAPAQTRRNRHCAALLQRLTRQHEASQKGAHACDPSEPEHKKAAGKGRCVGLSCFKRGAECWQPRPCEPPRSTPPAAALLARPQALPAARHASSTRSKPAQRPLSPWRSIHLCPVAVPEPVLRGAAVPSHTRAPTSV